MMIPNLFNASRKCERWPIYQKDNKLPNVWSVSHRQVDGAWQASIESSPVWDTSYIKLHINEVINWLRQAMKCTKPVTIQYLHAAKAHRRLGYIRSASNT